MTAVTRTALLFSLALLLSCGDNASRSVDIAIEHVTLVDAINPIRENQTVLIDDGRIVAIVNSDTKGRVSAQTTVDGSGQILIPGLWDFHVHFTFDTRFTDAMAGLFLYHGVTNVRDTGGLLEDLLGQATGSGGSGSSRTRRTTPMPAEKRPSEQEQSGGFGDIFGDMLEPGGNTSREYQRQTESVFDDFLKS